MEHATIPVLKPMQIQEATLLVKQLVAEQQVGVEPTLQIKELGKQILIHNMRSVYDLSILEEHATIPVLKPMQIQEATLLVKQLVAEQQVGVEPTLQIKELVKQILIHNMRNV